MEDGTGSRSRGRHRPAVRDLAAVSLAAVADLAAVVAVDSPVHGTLLALPLLAVGPGYAGRALLDATLRERPAGRRGPDADGGETAAPWPRELARVVAASLLVVSAVGAALAVLTPWDGLTALVAGAAASTVGLATAAAVQRYRRGVPGPSLPAPETTGEWSVGVFVVSGALLLAVGVAVGPLAPDPGGFTEFSVRDPGEQRGIDPGPLVPGDPTTYAVTVENREGERTNYTVVAQVEVVDGNGGNATVTERDAVRRYRLTLDHGDSRTLSHEFVAPARTERVRAAYHLYRGRAPARAVESTAYRSVYVRERGAG